MLTRNHAMRVWFVKRLLFTGKKQTTKPGVRPVLVFLCVHVYLLYLLSAILSLARKTTLGELRAGATSLLSLAEQ